VYDARRERKQYYYYLCYQHHVILGLEEVNRLVRTVTDELGTCGLTTLSAFPALPLISAHLVFTAISKLFFVLVVRSCAGHRILMA
jgi:hypothetical protein